jgi:anti-sigma28 factor (negative regulator of flagellin synthesis)
MKIQAERPDELVPTQTNADRNRSRTEPTPLSDRPNDRIDVSSDALLLNSAVRAAQEAPEIRPAVVERARMKMLSGDLGHDADRLADRLIDHMLKL